MKKTRMWIAIGIVCFLLLAMMPVGIMLGFLHMEKSIQEYSTQWQQIEYVAFSDKSSEEATPDFIPVTEIMDYESKYSDYNSYVCYDNALSEKDQFIYRIYEYALDNCTPYIYVENSLLTGNRSFVNIMELLSMDSSLVEQNAYVEYEDFSHTISQQYIYKTLEKKINGTCIYIRDFSAEKTGKMEEAISAAKEITKKLNIDKDSTDKEIAMAIYRYLGQNVTYKDYGDEVNNNYLYDAICKNSSNCDGYSNAFALLCGMYDIPCVEKISINDKYANEGHTWNCVMLDGTWYNVDATYSPDLFDGALKDIPFRFGFSDNLQFYKYKYNTLLPACTEDLIPLDCQFSSCEDEYIVSDIVEAFYKTDKDYVLITFDTYDDDTLRSHMQEIANRMYGTIYYISYTESNCNFVIILRE